MVDGRRYRSGLEGRVAASLAARGVAFGYEDRELSYGRTYVPDFTLPPGGSVDLVECKGYLPEEDRTKLLAVREANPGLRIGLVFQTPFRRLGRKGRTGTFMTYASWARKHGFPWAHGDVPDEWIGREKPFQEACRLALEKLGPLYTALPLLQPPKRKRKTK